MIIERRSFLNGHGYHAMNSFVRFIAAGLIAIVLLSLFSIGYCYTGIHVTNTTRATDYVWRPNEFKSNMTEGFSWHITDDNGFNNDTVPSHIDILLMGSSHTEAFQLRYEDCIAGRLNRVLDNKITYNIGVSGHTIYRCVNNIASALDTFSPTEYVVIETSTIELDKDEMQKVIDGNAGRLPSYDKGVLYYLQLIPAFRPIYSQLDSWFSNNTKSNDADDTDGPDAPDTDAREQYRQTLCSFLSIISASSAEAGVTPIIFYHPTESITPAGNLSYLTDSDRLADFISACNSQGIVFVDTTSALEAAFNHFRYPAHGFTNTAIGKGHLNKYGHAAIAHELANCIQNLEAP